MDSGLIVNEYVVLYELAINDSNHIYRIQAADCPADLKFEYPSRIIKYKDKYLCFIELDESPMTADEMIEVSIPVILCWKAEGERAGYWLFPNLARREC